MIMKKVRVLIISALLIISCTTASVSPVVFADAHGTPEENLLRVSKELDENQEPENGDNGEDIPEEDSDNAEADKNAVNRELAPAEEEQDEEQEETDVTDKASDEDEEIDKDTEEIMEEKPMKSLRGLRASATTSLKVKKTWSDYWNAHDPVQIELLKKNANDSYDATGTFITLSQSNNWEASFTGLDVPADGQSFAYSVREVAVEGYKTQYGQMKENSASSGGDYWVPVSGNALSNGEYVFLFNNNTSYVMTTGAAASTYLTATAVTKNGQINLNGTTYSSYLTGVPDAAVFTASASGSGFKLRNDTRFIRGSGFTTSTTAATTWAFRNGVLIESGDEDFLRYNGSRFIFDDDGTSTKFTLYKRVSTGSTERSYEIELTNIKTGGEQDPIISQAKLDKRIDYLGDGVANNDTDIATTMTAEELKDFYRLYLSVESTFQAIDLLIVSDVTNSMDKTDMSGLSRKAVLDQVVNGTIISGSGETAQRRDDGVAYQFLSLHPDNKIACICFSGGWNSSEHGKTYDQVKDLHATLPLKEKFKKNWVKKSEMGAGTTPRDCYVRVTKKDEPGGTNYETPLMRADEVLNEVKNDGNLKVMVFLTDGEPNTVFDPGITQSPSNTTVLAHTEKFFKEWIAAHEGIITYIVGVSPDANTGEVYSTLTRVADAAHGVYYTADTKGDLENSLQDIVNRSKLSLVQINDDISEYVEYYGANPDLKVEMTDLDGSNKVALWENGGPTVHNVTEDGISILSDVIVETPGEGKSGGQIKVVYNKDCRLDGTHKFILSYNAKIAESARDSYFASGGYGGVKGDLETDYPGNSTSSNNAGFRSNDMAGMAYTTFGIAFDKEFPHPVVQVPTKTVKIVKEGGESGSDLLRNAKFELYKTTASSTTGAALLPSSTDTYAIKAPSNIVTDSNGSANITVPNGTYHMYEVEAPNGHFILDKPISFEVKNSGLEVLSGNQYVDGKYVTVREENNTILLSIKNQVIYELPKAGGIGTWVFTIFGTYVLFLVTMTIAKRKRANQ